MVLFILIFLWLMCSTIFFLNYDDNVAELTSWRSQTLAIIVFLLGGPSFLIVNALSGILDTIFPEGWDDKE